MPARNIAQLGAERQSAATGAAMPQSIALQSAAAGTVAPHSPAPQTALAGGVAPRNIALLLEYDGSLYHGWQSQTNAPAVQDAVAAALCRLDGAAHVRLSGASRTDAGVHARGQVANFCTESAIPAEKYAYALNTLLPEGICCAGSAEAPPEFHSRFSARGKAYSYRILNRRFPSALLRDRAWHVPMALDVGAMRAAAAHIVGKRDFAAFMSSGSPVSSTVRTVWELSVERGGDNGNGGAGCAGAGEDAKTANDAGAGGGAVDAWGAKNAKNAKDAGDAGDIVELRVSGDGFLYNMVRIIAGTLVYVGLGRIGAEAVEEILRGRERKAAGKTAPPQGLCLEAVFYGDSGPTFTG
ncbi:MAG: tRNA pseudouridine synthase A [Clostridiales bacterium]|nr:tRNA pseudouridine synthase A [Clostridiales bacterium]